MTERTTTIELTEKELLVLIKKLEDKEPIDTCEIMYLRNVVNRLKNIYFRVCCIDKSFVAFLDGLKQHDDDMKKEKQEENPLYACPNCYRVSDEKPKEISYYENKSIIPGCISPQIAVFETLTCCKYCNPKINNHKEENHGSTTNS